MYSRLAAALLLSLPLAAQQICLAEGTVASLRIATVSESNPNGGDTVVLQNAELLAIEISARTIAREFEASRSRRTVRHGIARVELPDGGRLFRYRRNNGQQWGFLHVAALGAARVVLELPGINGLDPFADRIGVADDGRHAVIPVAAGGLHAVKLDGTDYASTGRPDRLVATSAQSVEAASTMVGPTHCFYITGNDRIFRCALADGAAPVDVTPPSAINDELEDEMAMSGDGTHVVFLHGPQQLQRMWRATTSGGAVVLSPPASRYEEPAYLPGGVGSPSLLLNDDGTRLFFVDIGPANSDELYLLDLTGALPVFHVTADPLFLAYIGVYILPRFHGQRLLAGIGYPGRMDYYHVAMDAAGGSVVNLTGTGPLQPPFGIGALGPVAVADAGGSMLFLERHPSGFDLRRMDVTTGANAIVQRDSTLTLTSGIGFNGLVDCVVQGAGGDGMYRGHAATPFAMTPAGVGITAPVHGPAYAATRVHLQIPWSVPAFYLPDGTVIAGALEFDLQQVVLTQGGGFVLNGQTVRFTDLGGTVTLNRPPAAVRYVLSGAGG